MDYQGQAAYLAQTYCCTEALVRFGLWLKNEENPLLVKASGGLCNGMYSGFNCGALAGGCMLLSMFDRGLAARVMIPELTEWFDSVYGIEYGSINCEDLRGGSPKATMDFCRPLICAIAEKCVEILQNNKLLEE